MDDTTMLNRRQLIASVGLFLSARPRGFAQEPPPAGVLAKPVVEALTRSAEQLSTRKFAGAVSALEKVQKELGAKLTDDEKRALAVGLADAHFAWGLESQRQGRWQEALTHYQAAYALDKTYREQDAAADLHNLGVVSTFLGEPAKALEFYNQALPLRRSTADQAGEARTLNNLGKLYEDRGELPRALELYNQALPLRKASGDRAGEARTLGSLFALWQSPRFGQRSLAVALVYGKQAGNLYLSLPEGIRSLDRGTAKNPALTIEGTFRLLAESLFTLDRSQEALQVLEQVKTEQYLTLFPSERKSLVVEPKTLAFTQREQVATSRLSGISERLSQVTTELAPLAKKTKRTPDETLQHTQLTQLFATTRERFLQALEELNDEFRQPGVQQERVDAIPEVISIQTVLKALEPGHVALYTFVGDEALFVLLVTPETVTLHKSAIKAAELKKQVQQFRWLLQTPSLDPRPAGKALYDLFLAPFENTLSTAKHLLLTLDQSLPAIPFAALYDGTRYALERWSTSLLTPASPTSLLQPVTAERCLAVGVSEGTGTTIPLAGVAQEVQALGQPALLNVDFTEERWLENLQKEKLDICHVASPFNLVGPEGEWGLLLADGKKLSLEQLRLLPADPLSSLSLLTFSTFQTPAQDTERSQGAIESIAQLAQSKGVAAVLTNVWSVSDSITSALMVDFYRRWRRNTTKSLALRDAQLAVLRGETKPGAQLRTGPIGRLPTLTAPAYPALERRLHPFYWAGFALYGNPR